MNKNAAAKLQSHLHGHSRNQIQHGRGAVTWNSLSAEAKQATTLNSFYSAIVD